MPSNQEPPIRGLNWNVSWQHSLDEEPGARFIIKQRGAPFLQKKPARLVSQHIKSASAEMWQGQLPHPQ